MSRGNRTGNNAFVEEPKIDQTTFRKYIQSEYFIERMLKMRSLNMNLIEKIMKIDKNMN